MTIDSPSTRAHRKPAFTGLVGNIHWIRPSWGRRFFGDVHVRHHLDAFDDVGARGLGRWLQFPAIRHPAGNVSLTASARTRHECRALTRTASYRTRLDKFYHGHRPRRQPCALASGFPASTVTVSGKSGRMNWPSSMRRAKLSSVFGTSPLSSPALHLIIEAVWGRSFMAPHSVPPC